VADLIDLDLLEACVLGIPDGKSSGRVRPVEVVSSLKRSNPGFYDMTTNEVSRAIKRLFPIHKNPRCRTKVFKVATKSIDRYLDHHKMCLRPRSEAAATRIGKATRIELEARVICRPIGQKASRLWNRSVRRLEMHLAILRVEDVNDGTLSIAVPQWNIDQAFHIPLASLPTDLQSKVAPGIRLFAKIYASKDIPCEIRLDSFEIAPQPDPEDGLSYK
jgi:hypothetical protein